MKIKLFRLLTGIIHMTLVVEDSKDINESVHSDRDDKFAIEAKDGALRVCISEPVFGGVVAKSDQVTMKLRDDLYDGSNGAIHMKCGGRITVDGNVHGDIIVNHPKADVDVRGNLHGDVTVKKGRHIRCRQAIHGDVEVRDPSTKVRLGTVYDDLYAENSVKVSYKKVFGSKNIKEKRRREKEKRTHRDVKTKKRHKKSEPSNVIYDKDFSSIESDKLAVWITASIADVESTLKDVWLTDKAYQNVNLPKLLREVDTVQKAKKLDTYNNTVNFTDKQIKEIENANEATRDSPEETIQDIIEHLAEESYDKLHKAIVEFERGKHSSKTNEKEEENISEFEDI